MFRGPQKRDHARLRAERRQGLAAGRSVVCIVRCLFMLLGFKVSGLGFRVMFMLGVFRV